jgi:hypothetical protein
MLAELERLKQENEALKEAKRRPSHLKVSQKGAVSVYGLGRFPVTLYQEQWERLFERVPEIEKFIQENQSVLKRKASPGEPQ